MCVRVRACVIWRRFNIVCPQCKRSAHPGLIIRREMIRRGVSGNKYVCFINAVFGESFAQPLLLREGGMKRKQSCDLVFPHLWTDQSLSGCKEHAAYTTNVFKRAVKLKVPDIYGTGATSAHFHKAHVKQPDTCGDCLLFRRSLQATF